MDDRLPIAALLSHSLVAFIIEFDNEFEHRMPHRTTNHGASSGSPGAPWLVSMVMWSKFLRFIPDEGIAIADLQRLTGISRTAMQTWLTRLRKWWGYITVDTEKMVRPTSAGRKALTIWRTLEGEIETRWRERFGGDEIDCLRRSLVAVVNPFNSDVPDSLPILGYGLYSRNEGARPLVADTSALPLPALLSKVLLAFALEFETASTVSLAICANVLRLLGAEPRRSRDFPRLSGVSKESIAIALSFLQKRGYAITESGSVVLTEKGLREYELYGRLVWDIEDRWQTQFGVDIVRNLRDSLEHLDGDLFSGLEPYPDGWRASEPKPQTLPHYPMVTHRGAFPDGS